MTDIREHQAVWRESRAASPAAEAVREKLNPTEHGMNEDELSYALSKKVSTFCEIQSHYGSIALDEELAEAVRSAVRPLLEARLAKMRSEAAIRQAISQANALMSTVNLPTYSLLLAALKMFVWPYQEGDRHTDVERQEIARRLLDKAENK
jgi:hypothetical protein